MKRSLIVPMLDVLDFCDTSRSAARRNVTSVPTQALTLLNGEFVNRQARHLADRLEREAGAGVLFRRSSEPISCLFAGPHAKRNAAAVPAFLDREGVSTFAEAAKAGEPIAAAKAHHEALGQLCRSIFNTNDFPLPGLGRTTEPTA